ncbi:MAG TPA: hypothetical protein VKG91_19530, partial [Roseiarcus sp.]|nr:hypothetical protein [Roseiarcus sp.]
QRGRFHTRSPLSGNRVQGIAPIASGFRPYSQTNTTPGGCMRQPDKHATKFQIDSSFALYSQISIEGGTPIPVGGFPIAGVAAVPEPPTGVLLALPMLVLGFARWRAKA